MEAEASRWELVPWPERPEEAEKEITPLALLLHPDFSQGLLQAEPKRQLPWEMRLASYRPFKRFFLFCVGLFPP